MSEEESREIRTLRMMAWQRVKGELKAILETYWNNPENFEQADAFVERAIKEGEEIFE